MFLRKKNQFKMSLLPKFIYGFNITTSQIPVDLIVAVDKLFLKFIWKCRQPRLAKTNLKKSSKNVDFLFSKLYRKLHTVIKDGIGIKIARVDHCNRIVARNSSCDLCSSVKGAKAV